MEAFDDAADSLNEKLKISAAQLVRENKDSETYLETKRVTSLDIYRYLAADGSLKFFVNMAILFKTALLVPPTTSNVERGFSMMNLICTPLRTSLRESNLDRFMRICINGPETFSEDEVEKIVDIFKRTKDNKRLDL